jgi:hypothetical protein
MGGGSNGMMARRHTLETTDNEALPHRNKRSGATGPTGRVPTDHATPGHHCQGRRQQQVGATNTRTGRRQGPNHSHRRSPHRLQHPGQQPPQPQPTCAPPANPHVSVWRQSTIRPT